MHDDYRQVDTTLSMEPCPVCSNKPRLWHYSENETVPVQHVVMCPTDEDELPSRNGLIGAGCLLRMPPQDFYCESDREAVGYWNRFAKEVVAYRTEMQEK